MSAEGLSSIRENSRDHILRQRKENRLRAFAVNRQGIEKIHETVFSPSNIAALATTLKHKSQVNHKILSELSQGLAVSLENARAFIEADGSIHYLSTYLTGGDAELQLEAAYCVANLALWTEEPKFLKHILRHSSCYLVIFLSSCNPLLQQACTWAITNLLPNGFEMLSKLNFLPKLIHLGDSPHDYVRRSVVECFIQLIATCYEKLQKSELMEILCIVVTLTKRRCSPIEMEPLAWLLFHLTTHDIFHEILLESKIILWVIDNLNQRDNRVTGILETQIPLLRCLGNLCAVDEKCIEIALDSGCIVKVFVQLLDTVPFSFVYKEVAWALGNIVNVRSDHLQQKIYSSGLREETEKYLKAVEHLL